MKSTEVFSRIRLKFTQNKCININNSRCMSSIQAVQTSENEYTEVPKYPAIIDPSKKGIKLRERQVWYNKIKAMPIVEEKLLEMAENRYWVHFVRPTAWTYGIQPFQQHATRTRLIQNLPDEYNTMNVDQWVDRLRQSFLDCFSVELEHRGKAWKYNEAAKFDLHLQTKRILRNMISLVVSTGSEDYDHLATAQVQDVPRIDYYWWHGKFYGNSRKALTEYKTACLQSVWEPAFQINSDKPLPQYLEREDSLCTTVDIPECPYHPSVWRVPINYRYPTCVPGYWPGAKAEYPLITFETKHNLLEYMRRNYDESYTDKIIDGIGIMGLFSSLGAVATYHGFTPFHELTYPLTSQLVVTDGRLWTFLTYQLNTICFHPDVDTASHCNICWSSGPMELYQAIENGEPKGVNDEVLRTLLKFFFRQPAIRQGVNMKPYLGEHHRELSEVQEIRKNLQKKYDNRVDMKVVGAEIPTWHWVYKKNPLAPISPRIKLW